MTGAASRIPGRVMHSLAFTTLALILFLPLATPVGAQEVPELEINSEAYIVIDADTGEIFAQKNASEHRAMASLTKVFTAIEAIKRAPLDRTITTAEDDVFTDASTRVGFGAGEQFTLNDLLYGMLLPSGNDAAHAIARAIGTQPGDTGDEGYERFIGWMNERLQMMGLTDTHLVNPHGWGVPNHYSTAHDLATFMRYALGEPAFVEAIGTAGYSTANGYSFTNTNKLLNSYSPLLGGKTGYDDDAGYCLIEVAQQNGHTMISVTLDGVAPDDWYDDNRVLLDYAFTEVEARGGVIEGDVASFNNPDLALLSSVASRSVIQGTQIEADVAAQPTSAPDVAVVDAPETAPETGDVGLATQEQGAVPGFTWPLAVAFVIAALIFVMAGRELRDAETPFGTVMRSYFDRNRRPKRLREQPAPVADEPAKSAPSSD